MKRLYLQSFVALVVCLLFSSTVYASILTYEFTGGYALDDIASSYSYTLDDVTLTITATAGGSSTNVSKYWEGHGVKSNSIDIVTLDDAISGTNEAMIFTFSEPVMLSELRFRQWGSSDEVDLIYSGGTITLDNANYTSDGLNIDHFVLGDIELQSFILDTSAHGSGTAFHVKGITVIPLPGAFWLLTAGIIGIVSLKKQDSKC